MIINGNQITSVSKGNILVVDDMPANLRLLVKMLNDQGYKVRAANNGAMALTVAQTKPVDLILLDIRMPEMNGYEVCKRLKTDKRTWDIPIIFISALSEVTDKIKGFSLGGVDYITKPFQPEEVLARVETHLVLQHMKKHLEEKNARLQEALNNIKTLSGLLPLCTNCKKIRDDKGYWSQVEEYIQQHSDALITHSLCPDCADSLYGNEEWYKALRNKSD